MERIVFGLARICGLTATGGWAGNWLRTKINIICSCSISSNPARLQKHQLAVSSYLTLKISVLATQMTEAE